jgi:hypothetical protein
MQYACVMLSSVACPAVQYFSTLPHKQHVFRKEVTEYKLYVLIFSIPLVRNISHSKKNWGSYDRSVYRYSRKILIILVGLL